MLTKTKMQEIQDLKLQGYTKADIIRYYEAQGRKPPSRPTISKYYDMDVIPDDPGAKLAKPKSFDAEPFRSTIIRILETNSGKSFCMSSVYDVLEEKFIENGDYEKLPGNQQTLRNYIHYLEDSGQVNREPEHRRIYDYVRDRRHPHYKRYRGSVLPWRTRCFPCALKKGPARCCYGAGTYAGSTPQIPLLQQRRFPLMG